ncbi:hypothetical protein GPECTOR_2g1555 [Gonium pectorale]|uniref:Uncharacterized protein n=1 Tax=Gonium pectorale TaxID=33097 RepID=A0A150H1W4_GONPE|nr:hypothetical protein GPECTOR_2g1555 [Gonium pectorale]|eukprot:KXZ56003.1 hypothetical protein GPECTOR_2g1555 [Gonium pectorale]
MNTGVGSPGGDGQPPQASPTLGQLKEALRVLENTQNLFTSMKNQVVYACGEGHLLAADEGRQYLARIVRTLDDEHRAIRAGWPRLTAALEVARVVNKVAAARGTAAGGSGAVTAHARVGGAAGAAGPAAGPAAALQSHCRSVLASLDAAVCEGLLGAGPHGPGERRAKRQRMDDDADVGGTASAVAAAAAAAAAGNTPSPPHPSTSSPSPPRPLAPPGRTRLAAAAGGSGGTLELVSVLLRLRALDGGGRGGGGGGASSSTLGGMRLHALDDGGNALALPSALTAALAAAATATSAAVAGGGSGPSVPAVDGALLAAGAARLAGATQVRMLIPGVFVANVLLAEPGSPAPLRVAVDSADRAFEMDPWATPASQPAQPAAAPLAAEPRSPGGAALEELLLWLLTCRDLFSKRCAATGRLLAWDPSVQYPVPPIFRAFKLPRAELRLRAVELPRVAAYHMHVAPLEELGWEEDVQAQAAAGWGVPPPSSAPAATGNGDGAAAVAAVPRPAAQGPV